MKSTGESMGIDADPFLAYYRAQLGANVKLPLTGKVLWVGTQSTSLEQRLRKLGYSVEHLPSSNDSTTIPDLLIDLTASRLSRRALEHGTALYTTLEAAEWLVSALEKVGGSELAVSSVQEWLA
jgi:carbamoyl-phosphate synthase large subunit